MADRVHYYGPGYDEFGDQYDDGQYDGYCTFCGGEGWDECDDPYQCTSEHLSSGLCPCKACGGSGNATDQTIW